MTIDEGRAEARRFRACVILERRVTDVERLRDVTPEDVMRVAGEYFTEENRSVGWLVETVGEGEREEQMDFAEIMAWAQTLPQAEQAELMTRFQSLDEAGREALVKELWERMQAEKTGK